MVANRIVIVLVAALSVGVNRGRGCECATMDICERVEETPVIFLAEVIDGGLEPEQNAWMGTARFAKLRVIEAFRGLPPNTREVTMELSFMPGMCSAMPYRKGEQTLVFVSPEANGALSDGGCTQSRFAEDAKEDIEYVRRYFRGETKTTIRGRVAANMHASLVDFILDQDHSEGLPVAGAEVIAEAGGRKYSARADNAGRYELTGVSSGVYALHAQLDGYTDKDDPREPNEPASVAERGCAIKNLSLCSQNSLEGSVVGPDRQPIPNVAIFLQKVDQPGEWGEQEQTNERGEFVFKEIDPGLHYLVVSPQGATPASPFSPSFYGNSQDREHAKPIDIRAKSTLKDYVVMVNQIIPTRTLRVHLTDSEGRPLAETFVQCAESGPSDGIFHPIADGKSDSAGIAACRVLGDRAYRISAARPVSSQQGKAEGADANIPAGSQDEEVYMQLKPVSAPR